MIDPIHNQAYQEYTKVSHPKPQDMDQKFSMDSAMQENPSSNSSTDGVIYEPSKASESESDKAISSGSGHAAHSYNSKASTSETTTQTPRATASSTSTESLGTIIKRLFQNMLQRIKKVLSAIWESKPAEGTTSGDSVKDENPEIIEASDLDALNAEISATEAVDAEAFDPQAIDPFLDADIKKALKAKDTDSFRTLLSQDGHRIPAKNTSLLTYYDSKGNLVNLDPSDQYRILHGDRGSQKL